MTYVLWIVQGLLALLFLFTGGIKLVLPIRVMTEQMPVPLPGPFLRIIGVAEVLGAVGLIFPWLLSIRPGLTPLTAVGLVIIMTGAMVLTLAEVVPGVVAGALIPLVVGLLSARRLRSLAADASIADPQVPVMFEIAVRGRGTCIWYGRVKI